ncbi:MAG: hypothetical protein WCD57_26145 [Acidobacteriaceae bacterium]
MTDKMEPLKKGDAVYIKKWNTSGTVLLARPTNIHEPEEDGYYEVQAKPTYFRRDELELDTTEADNAAREIRIAAKVDRRDTARRNLQEAINTGIIQPAIMAEYLAAEDEVSKELGIPSLFYKKHEGGSDKT